VVVVLVALGTSDAQVSQAMLTGATLRFNLCEESCHELRRL